jgi:hypothetical protein
MTDSKLTKAAKLQDKIYEEFGFDISHFHNVELVKLNKYLTEFLKLKIKPEDLSEIGPDYDEDVEFEDDYDLDDRFDGNGNNSLWDDDFDSDDDEDF